MLSRICRTGVSHLPKARHVRAFSDMRRPGNLASFLSRNREGEQLSEHEQSLGRPMTKREKFEKEQMDKEKKPIEEEDHQEEVSFQGKYIHLKNIAFTAVCFYLAYQVHLRIVAGMEERRRMRDREGEEYDPSIEKENLSES